MYFLKTSPQPTREARKDIQGKSWKVGCRIALYITTKAIMIKLQVPLKYEDLTIKFENLGTKLAYFTKYVVNLKSIAFDKFSHCYVIEQGLAQLISEHETICFRFRIAAMDSVWTYFRYQTFNIEQDWTKNDSKCSVWSDLWFAIKLQELVSVCLTLMWWEI